MMLAKYFLKATIVSRGEWKAERPRKDAEKLKDGVTNLVVAFTETDSCETKDVCMKRVKDIQKKHIQESDSDIRYNFLIGGDGNVYEGRGWKVVSEFSENCKDGKRMKGDAVQVAFIGQYGTKPTMKMLKAFAGLLFNGVEQQAIVKDIKKLKPSVVIGNKVHTLKGSLTDAQLTKLGDKHLAEEYKKLKGEIQKA